MFEPTRSDGDTAGNDSCAVDNRDFEEVIVVVA